MTVHNNVYIPRESWPYWTWFVIEFSIVFAASLMITTEIMGIFKNMGIDQVMQNWIFWSIVAILFFVWYILLRRIILKRPVLENSY